MRRPVLWSGRQSRRSSLPATPPGPAPLGRRECAGRFAGLLPVGHPDVLDLGGALEEFLTLAAHRVGPVARAAVVRPRALHVARGESLDLRTPLARTEVPERVHVVVRREHARELVPAAGDDVDDAG